MVTRTTSSSGIALIKRFETFSRRSYVCPAGKLTIGYGHVIRPSDRFVAPISEPYACGLLADDLRTVEIYLTATLPDAPQCQFDALASFAFNAGLGALDKSTLLKKLKAGDVDGAANEFGRWVWITDPVSQQRVKLAGLITRRAAERDLFLESTRVKEP